MTDPLRPQGGFADLLGYRLETWREDYAEVMLDVEARHMNRSGVLHGGVVSSLLDTALGYAGTFSDDPAVDRRAFTLSLNTHFVGTASIGQTLTAAARKTGGGRKIYFCTGEVRDQDGRLVGQGEGVFRYRGSGTGTSGTASGG